MRVIAGSARGRKLAAPDGDAIRPTTDRVKESVFSALQFDLEGRRVLDLFAGSGQLGIEALSRGAAFADFVDISRDAVKLVEENLRRTGLAANAKVHCGDWRAFLAAHPGLYDLIFLDPPYGADVLAEALAVSAAVLSPFGAVVCEHPDTQTLPEAVDGIRRVREYKYGRLRASLYRAAKEDEL